nr:zinc finger, CCHC-type [Tanacetum cinerariifolium]
KGGAGSRSCNANMPLKGTSYGLSRRLSVVYVLTTPMLEDGGENPTVEQVRRRAKWDNNDYVCRGLILNGMPDSLFDVYQNVETYKELWDTLEAKYMGEDASSKKFLVSNFTNYKMTDSRPVLEQYNELLGILRRFTQHKINMDESIQLGSHLHIEESLRVQDSDKPKGNNAGGPSVVNMVEHNNSSIYNDNKDKRKHHDTKADPNNKPKTKKKPNLNYLKVWGCKAAVRLLDPKLKTLGERGIECIFVRYAEHSKAFRFYVIEPNDSVAINSIVESGDAIFDEHRFSSVPRPSQRSLKDGTEDFSGLVVFERVTEKEQGMRSLINTPIGLITFDEAIKFQDVALWKEAINDEIDSIMGNNTWVLTDIPPAFLNEELEEKVYMNQSLGFIMPGNENKVDLTNVFLSSRFFMKDMGEVDVIFGIRIKHDSNCIAISQSLYIEKVLKKFNYSDCTIVSTPLDTCEKLMPNKGPAVSQLEYSRVTGCLMYAMTCTRSEIAFAMGKLSRYTSNPSTQHWQAIQMVLKYLKKTMDYRLVYSGYPSVLEGYTDANWISNTKDNSSTSGWVFLLGGGAISTMEYEFVALAAAGKEAELLKKLAL